MKKFEYHIFVSGFYDVDALNGIGIEGWELISIVKRDDSTICAYFKREIVVEYKDILTS